MRHMRLMVPLLLMAVVSIFLANLWQYRAFTQDDSYIFFRYAQNLAQGWGPVYNAGERVEGYTSFLWLLLLTPGATVHLDLDAFAKVLGVFLSIATLFLTYRVARDILHHPSWLSLLAPLTLALSAPFALWSVGGLETPLYTLLLVLSLYLYAWEEHQPNRFPSSAIAIALTTLARPEGLIFLAITLLHRAFFAVKAGRWHRRDTLWLAICTGTPVAYEVFRLLYYGLALPNTYYAKAGGDLLPRLREGMSYVREFLGSLGGAAFLLFPVLLFLKRLPTYSTSYVLLTIASLTAAVVFEGGDWMPLYRFLVPLLPLLFLMMQQGLAELISFFWAYPLPELRSVVRGTLMAVSKALALGIFLLLPLMGLRFGLQVPQLSHGFQIRVESSGLRQAHIPLGRWLHDHAQPSDTVVVVDAGAIPYFSGLRAVDMSALADPFIARLRYRYGPRIFQADGSKEVASARADIREYVLNQHPQWIVYVVLERQGNDFPLSQGQKHMYDLQKDPRFRENYAIVRWYIHYELKEGSGYYLLLYQRQDAS